MEGKRVNKISHQDWAERRIRMEPRRGRLGKGEGEGDKEKARRGQCGEPKEQKASRKKGWSKGSALPSQESWI